MKTNKGLDEALKAQIEVLRKLKHEGLCVPDDMSSPSKEDLGKPVHATYIPQSYNGAQFRVWVGEIPIGRGNRYSYQFDSSGENWTRGSRMALSVSGKADLVEMVRDALLILSYWSQTPVYDGTRQDNVVATIYSNRK